MLVVDKAVVEMMTIGIIAMLIHIVIITDMILLLLVADKAAVENMTAETIAIPSILLATVTDMSMIPTGHRVVMINHQIKTMSPILVVALKVKTIITAILVVEMRMLHALQKADIARITMIVNHRIVLEMTVVEVVGMHKWEHQSAKTATIQLLDHKNVLEQKEPPLLLLQQHLLLVGVL